MKILRYLQAKKDTGLFERKNYHCALKSLWQHFILNHKVSGAKLYICQICHKGYGQTSQVCPCFRAFSDIKEKPLREARTEIMTTKKRLSTFQCAERILVWLLWLQQRKREMRQPLRPQFQLQALHDVPHQKGAQAGWSVQGLQVKSRGALQVLEVQKKGPP